MAYTSYTPAGKRLVITPRDITVATYHKLFMHQWCTYTTYDSGRVVKEVSLQVIPVKSFKKLVNSL